jgi:hypothetical protein
VGLSFVACQFGVAPACVLGTCQVPSSNPVVTQPDLTSTPACNLLEGEPADGEVTDPAVATPEEETPAGPADGKTSPERAEGSPPADVDGSSPAAPSPEGASTLASHTLRCGSSRPRPSLFSNVPI